MTEPKLKNKDKVYSELERIRKRSRGILKPVRIVREAEPPDSPLHKHFTWDDTKAAHAYRLEQARHLIRVFVTVKESLTTRTYVSVETDRKGAGGYRTIEDVMRNPHLRNQLLEQAYKDMEAFRQKYRVLKKLEAVIATIDATLKRAKRTKR